VRLDQFLKWSRVVPRRSLAKAMCDSGRVSVNQSEARAGRQISVGDSVAVDFPHRRMTFRVVMIPENQPRKSDSSRMVEVLDRDRQAPSGEWTA
jgi:ribosomal 50S subunit-recycling heat shock protein